MAKAESGETVTFDTQLACNIAAKGASESGLTPVRMIRRQDGRGMKTGYREGDPASSEQAPRKGRPPVNRARAKRGLPLSPEWCLRN